MREFIYFSSTARTTGNFDTSNLILAGRMDIAVHVIIAAFFYSQKVREDVKLHLVFYGMPDPPRHIEMMIQPGVSFAKTDVAGIIKRILYKYKEGKKTEVSPGYFVEKKSLLKLVEELQEQGRSVYVLDKGGEDIREVEIVKDPIFLLGDHHGLPRKELKRLKKMTTPVSIGQRMYFASHTMAVVQNELDRRGL